MNLEIRHQKTLVRTPAMLLAIRGWQEIAEQHGSHDIMISWDHQAIVAYDEAGNPAGVLTWVEQEWNNAVTVGLAYVEPQHRRQRVHTTMFRALIDKARELKRPWILSGFLASNTASASAQLLQGREVFGMSTRFAVPPE